MSITPHRTHSPRHSTFYRAFGPEDGPLVIMTHGWPELSISWRHQLVFLGNLGFRAIAPDMRGYGGSSLYDEKGAYAQTEVVQDMIELIDSLGRQKAVWIGHDWGSPVAYPWMRGARVSLSVENLFDERLDVRDATGAVPISYQPDLLDPQGRVVQLSFRKLFLPPRAVRRVE